MEEAEIRFTEGQSKFSFYLECTKDEENFFFPISTTMDLREYFPHTHTFFINEIIVVVVIVLYTDKRLSMVTML